MKVAAEVTVSARRVPVRLAANWPFLPLYERLAAALRAPPATATARYPPSDNPTATSPPRG